MAIFGKAEGASGSPASPERTGAPAGAPSTLIGPNVRFVGELSGDEDVVIQGDFEGNIDVRRRVTVAGAGKMKGDIHARSVVVGGKVQGQIRADERAELLASAAVEGNVQAPKVVIAEGAQLQGSVAMASGAEPAAPDQRKPKEE